MTEDEAARGLPTFPPTYTLRSGTPVCTTCGAVIGGSGADQIRHSTWHANLAGLFALVDTHEPAASRGPLPFRASMDAERARHNRSRPELVRGSRRSAPASSRLPVDRRGHRYLTDFGLGRSARLAAGLDQPNVTPTCWPTCPLVRRGGGCPRATVKQGLIGYRRDDLSILTCRLAGCGPA